jgi:hypothetical protein
MPRRLTDASRIGRDLLIQLFDHLMDEPPLLRVERDALTGRFVRPISG